MTRGKNLQVTIAETPHPSIPTTVADDSHHKSKTPRRSKTPKTPKTPKDGDRYHDLNFQNSARKDYRELNKLHRSRDPHYDM